MAIVRETVVHITKSFLAVTSSKFLPKEWDNVKLKTLTKTYVQTHKTDINKIGHQS